MPALDDVAVAHDSQTAGAGVGIDTSLLKRLLWEWLIARKDQVAWRANFWFIHRAFTYGDLFPVFERLIGPAPVV